MAVDLPTSASLTGAGTTRAQQKLNLAALRDFMANLFGTDSSDKTAARATLGVAPRATRIDVASVAGAVDLTTAAPNTDDIRITGSLAITAFTVAVGRVIRVTAGGAFTLTSGASIVTQSAADIVVAAGDTFYLRATAANVVEVLCFSRAINRRVAQRQTSQSGVFATGATTIPYANLKPQVNEGDQYLARAFTPKNAGSTLVIEGLLFLGHSATTATFIAALFKDGAADAIAVGVSQNVNSGGCVPVPFRHEMVAGSVAAMTFTARAGSNTAGTTGFNGTSGSALMNGLLTSHLTITEYYP